MKAGDFVIAPEGCVEHLTAGKRYEVLSVDVDTDFLILDDEGEKLFCNIFGCYFLYGGDWILETKYKDIPEVGAVVKKIETFKNK